ncbi:hypothetical protein [Nocardioides sp. WS12]|uniref:hypothetical protein n=1 Tax=Nocardioides sp. WS12 TaxID=2486272 RepID=UPI0015F8A4E3|nr:hypothetical protein [Nocardioides sp. WS12]
MTGLFLTGQNLLNNRRENQRRNDDGLERERDRQHQERIADQARADARSDAWRAERREVHGELVALIRQGQRTIRSKLMMLGKDGIFRNAHQDVVELISADDAEALREAAARVEIVGSQASREAALNAVAQMSELDTRVWELTALWDGDDAKAVDKRAELAAVIKERHASLQKFLDQYVDAVRAELGTAD